MKILVAILLVDRMARFGVYSLLNRMMFEFLASNNYFGGNFNYEEFF